MNLELESPPETTEEKVLEAEILTPEAVKQLTKPEDFDAKLIRVREMASALKPHDTLSLQRVVALIEICDVAKDHAETRLNAIIAEPSKVVKDAKAIWTPFVNGFAELKKLKAAEAAQYVVEQQRIAAEQQRKAIEEARLAREKKEREEREQREEAERLRLQAERIQREEQERIEQAERDRIALEQQKVQQQQALEDAKTRGDEQTAKDEEARLQAIMDEEERQQIADEQARIAAEEEQARLSKLAEKHEAKADKAELAGSLVTTEVVPTQEKTINIGSSKLSTRAPKKIWLLPGWDKKKPLRLTDHALSKILGDITTLPPGIQFLLKYSDLNPVYLNKAFGEVEFPLPFDEGEDFSGSQLRK